ncbi:6372_t:CDS:2 [Dentiscutata erythropus]|uniref:6372_t:CDS:1 n=1 Tax=Dentiscutata erythropus TaxID=1348616 RepID=A0A9N9NR17_9GLOM|nr:6372_t:CDS:2 [Dentiscutata erythropus]
MDLLPNFVESLQSDSEFLNLEDYYETSDNYETTDNEYSSPVVSSKQILKKKQICVGGFTIFGGAPLIKKVVQELFPKKFTKKAKFSYNKLTLDQLKRLNDELLARSK